ncbi:endonuclease III [Candidatus Pacearchaeota archaeon]|nr:endonuclease III [Candidatus Pacearchaeota archaeon]
MDRKKEFLRIFKLADTKFGKSDYRLAGEAWVEPWQTVVVTIMSAQSRDETTIPIAEALFARYPTLVSLAEARYAEVLEILRSMNYNRTKARHVIACAKEILVRYNGEVPETIDELITLPGVGRKTANLVVTECFGKQGICVDTHVHRIANVLGLVKTKTPTETEFALMDVAPQRYWGKINRVFVLWGKAVAGRDKKKLLAVLR